MALCGALVNDVYKVFTFVTLGFGIAESAFDIFGKSFCKFLNFVFGAKGVIRRNAGLPAVERLAPGNLLDMLLDVYTGASCVSKSSAQMMYHMRVVRITRIIN